MSEPVRIGRWNYDKSVAKMRPLVIRWKTLTDEMLEELNCARGMLRNRPNGRNWGSYLEDIGLPARTAFRWLEQYDAENHKRIENVHFSSASNEWTTPAKVVEKVQEMFGVIDLDPCSPVDSPSPVPATRVFTEEDDGLKQEWSGRVYMNPPYGDELPVWVEKLVKEYEKGQVQEAVALIPARPDTAWFRALREYPRCFIFGRLKFGGQENSAPFPSMLVYMGKNIRQFKELMSEIGDVYKLYE